MSTINLIHTNAQTLAKKAVKLVLGKENDYVEKLLTNQIEGNNKQYNFTPLTELIPPQDRSELKQELSKAIDDSKQKAVSVIEKLSETKSDATSSNNAQPSTHHVIVDIGGMIPNIDNTLETVDLSGSQSVSSWVVNTLLQEKLNYREVQEKAERWKNINAILATILPIVSPIAVELIRYYFFNSDSSCSQ